MHQKVPVIVCEDFSFQYDAQSSPTLKNLNLTIYQGEKVLILGPSGSGKSTFAHLINGLIPNTYPGKTSGTMKVARWQTTSLPQTQELEQPPLAQTPLAGTKANSDADAAATAQSLVYRQQPAPDTLVPITEDDIFTRSLSVGTVLQDADGQFIGLTVAEDIAFCLENDCIPRQNMHQQVADWASRLNVEALLHHRPQDLSGGQKQRVALAGVLIDEVPILLLDEPLANLDPASGQATIGLIEEISQHANHTIIIVEHRLEDVLFGHVDRVILFDQGQIVADTTPDELLKSSLLIKTGIRQPLYVAALKYAGVNLDELVNLPSIDKLYHQDDAAQAATPVAFAGMFGTHSPTIKKALEAWQHQEAKLPQPDNYEPLLELNNVSFSYRESQPLLQNLNFTIGRGEMISLVGKNGAGKSTLIKLITGFVNGTGSLTWHDKLAPAEEKSANAAADSAGQTVGVDTSAQAAAKTAEEVLRDKTAANPAATVKTTASDCTQADAEKQHLAAELAQYQAEQQAKHKTEQAEQQAQSQAQTPTSIPIDLTTLTIKERADRIGYVMQNPNNMISQQLIFDEVALGLRLRNWPEDKIGERVEKILRICGLYPMRKWPISALSYGQKKRVTIASILVLDPQLLILDEPTAGQDYRNYTRMLEFLKQINQELGVSILLVTHDMHLMLEYTERALVLCDGKLIADAHPIDVLENGLLTQQASLKSTSLIKLAQQSQLEDPQGFMRAFIARDQIERKKRNLLENPEDASTKPEKGGKKTPADFSGEADAKQDKSADKQANAQDNAQTNGGAQ